MYDEKPAFALAATVHSDGAAGVVDSLTTTAELDKWLGTIDVSSPPANSTLLEGVRLSRRALRTLLSEMTGAPRTAGDLGDPFGVTEAIEVLNRDALAADRPGLALDEAGVPVIAHQAGGARAADRFLAALAVSAIVMVAGPKRDRLRACPAPRCVRYFYRQSPRQEWCKPSCGNRARVARHYRKRREE